MFEEFQILPVITYGVYFVVLWFFPSLLVQYSERLRASLQSKNPHLFQSKLAKEFLYENDLSKTGIFAKKYSISEALPSFFIKCFLTINPGIFIFVFASSNWIVGLAILCLFFVICGILANITTRMYRSEKNFLEALDHKFLKKNRRRRHTTRDLVLPSESLKSSTSNEVEKAAVNPNPLL